MQYLERVENNTSDWIPQSVPQWQAFLSRADEVFYGGQAGGGKTDLLLGMAACAHAHSAIFRRTYKNLKGIMRRARQVIGSSANENKSDFAWTWPDGRTLEFGAVQREDDKYNWQGRDHDFKGFDELPEISKSQYQFISGWNRSTYNGQRVRVVSAGNPPMDEVGEGAWVLEYWGAWLNPQHPKPAKSGELRWYATVEGEEVEFENGDPQEIGGETIYPRSRTFIRATLDDNPYLSKDNAYRSVLQSLPEPLRSKLLKGDFTVSIAADPFQVIPTQWVRQAQKRWLEMEGPEDDHLSAVGIDPSRGGRDKAALCKRYGRYFDDVVSWPGSVFVDGPIGAELSRQEIGDVEPGSVNIDIVGVGTAVFDSMKPMYKNVMAVNGASATKYTDRSGKLKMRNLRAELYWQLRDALDPEYGDNIALPPGNEILADLCAARYEVTVSGVLIEKKKNIKKRIGRSPDKGESIIYANYRPKKSTAGFVEVRGL